MSTPWPKEEPPPIICVCGHFISQHDQVNELGCYGYDSAVFCPCEKSQEQVYKTVIASLRSGLATALKDKAKLEEVAKRAKGQLDAGLAALHGSEINSQFEEADAKP